MAPKGGPVIEKQDVGTLRLELKRLVYKGYPDGRLCVHLYNGTTRERLVWLSREPESRVADVTVAFGLHEDEITNHFKWAMLSGKPRSRHSHIHAPATLPVG